MLYPGIDYQNAFFMFRETEIAHGGYDVPQCASTQPEECVHTIVGKFQIKMQCISAQAEQTCGAALITPNATFSQSDRIAWTYMLRTHGPACISMVMVNDDTNETICQTSPTMARQISPWTKLGMQLVFRHARGVPLRKISDFLSSFSRCKHNRN